MINADQQIHTMRVFRLNGMSFEPVQPSELPALLGDGTATLWVDMQGPSPEDVLVLRDVLNFDPLAIEDTTNDRQRPKFEEYDDYAFIIVNAIERLSNDDHTISFREIDVFLGQNYIVTVHEAAEPCIEYALRRCTGRQLNSHHEMSASFVFYTLIDKVVDDYFPLLDAVGEEIDEISERILEQPRQADLMRLYNLRRSLSEIWRISGQQRDMFSLLNRDESPLDRSGRLSYQFRDVHDHIIRISDTVNTFRDTLSGAVELYMSSFSNRLNVTLKRLTVLTLVIGILTLISGFYGMNFERTWPPFDSLWGVPLVICMMIVGVSAILFYVRRLD